MRTTRAGESLWSPPGYATDKWSDVVNATQFQNRAVQAHNAGLGVGTGAAGGGAANTSIGPISLVKVSKGGGFDDAATSALKTATTAKPNVSPIRSQIESILGTQAGADINATRAANVGDVETLARLSEENLRQGRDEARLHGDAVNRVYGDESDPNSLAARLRAADESRIANETARANRADQQTRLSIALRGGGGTGSYDSAAGAKAAAERRLGIAAEAGDLERRRIGEVQSAQERNLGRTADVRRALYQDATVPITARTMVDDATTRALGGRLSNLSAALGIDQATDELGTLARRLPLERVAQDIYNNASFFGVDDNRANFLFNPVAPYYGGGPPPVPWFQNRGGDPRFGGPVGGGGPPVPGQQPQLRFAQSILARDPVTGAYINRGNMGIDDWSALMSYAGNSDAYPGGFDMPTDTNYFRNLAYSQGSSPAQYDATRRAFE